MPIFEFQCRRCAHRFEEILSLAELEAGEAICPNCGSTEVERAMSTFATASSQEGPAPCGAPSRSACGTGGFT
jgi:putative FmdB family regulatory protein